MRVLLFAIVVCLIPGAWLSATQEASLPFGAEQIRMKARMVIHEGESQISRTIEVLFDSSGTAGYRLLTQVIAPGFLRNMKVLVIDSGSDSTTWTSTSRGVRRIGSRGGSERVFQSDFFVGDFTGWQLAEYDHEGLVMAVDLASEEDRPAREYRVLEIQTIDGQDFPKHVRMITPSADTHTDLYLEKIDTSPQFSPRSFNPAGL